VSENNGGEPSRRLATQSFPCSWSPRWRSPIGRPSRQAPLQERLEAVFERFLWKLRLIAILPVIMSLVSTGVTFVLGTLEIGKSILGLSHAADAVPRMRSGLSASPSCC
jgi:hypothetical protein